jgi:hypothetical protein
MDDDNNCEADIVTFSEGKMNWGQAAHGLYEITLREELAKMNELTGTLTLSSGVQAGCLTKA